MVVRTRLRAILTPLLLYAVSGAMSAYFVQPALMHSDTVDRDLASEEIRLKLGYVDPRDLVIFTDANRKR